MHGALDAVVQLPQVVLVNRLLQCTLLSHQCIHVRSVLAHQLAELRVARQCTLLIRHARLHILQHRLAVIQLRLLLQIPHSVPRVRSRPAVVAALVLARHYAHEGGFAAAVDAEHADLGAVVEGETEVGKERATGGEALGDAIESVRIAGGGAFFQLGFRSSGSPGQRSERMGSGVRWAETQDGGEVTAVAAVHAEARLSHEKSQRWWLSG